MIDAHFSIEEILGQEIALTYIRKYVQQPEKIPPLLIFHGPDGVGKWSLAERFSRHILCLETENCGNCASCKSFMRNNHPDFITFPADSRIAIGEEKDPVDFTIRWLQAKRLNFRPHLSQRRIILFPDAGLINDEAETALLKSLEEPPAHSRFIFLINDLKKLKQTIISRSITIPFSYLSQQALQQVAEKHNLPIHEVYGGSLSPFEAPEAVTQICSEKVRECADDSILLLELETWVRNYKDSHPEWPEDFDYKLFLELVALQLIYYYSKQGIEKNYQKLQALYAFKLGLHRNIAGIEPFLLSGLFHKLSYQN